MQFLTVLANGQRRNRVRARCWDNAAENLLGASFGDPIYRRCREASPWGGGAFPLMNTLQLTLVYIL